MRTRWNLLSTSRGQVLVGDASPHPASRVFVPVNADRGGVRAAMRVAQAAIAERQARIAGGWSYCDATGRWTGPEAGA